METQKRVSPPVSPGQTLGEWLREWRGDRSTYAAIRVLGVAESSYIQWEKGSVPRVLVAEALALHLGLTQDQMNQLTGRQVADVSTAGPDLTAIDQAITALRACREALAAISADGVTLGTQRHIELSLNNVSFDADILARARIIRLAQIQAGR